MFLFLIADLNLDGIVNLEDFAILANQWFDVPGNPPADIAPLYGGSNFIDELDLYMLTGLRVKSGMTKGDG